MSSFSRDTAHFSQMDAAMRQLGSWDPQSVIDSADRAAHMSAVLADEVMGWR